MPQTIQEIEAAVTQLSPEQLADFRAWFAEYEAQVPAAKVAHQQADWEGFAAQNLTRAYSEDEPTYTVADLKQTNPNYAGS